MTREEEIRNKAVNEQRLLMESMDWRAGFMSGAKWADEHPSSNGKELLYVAQKTAERTKKEFIRKAREWLENNKHLHKVFSFGSLSTDWDKFIREFCKAMEE